MAELKKDMTAAGRWQTFHARRSTLLERNRKCASVTIPYLLPPEGRTENDQLPTPYQGLGARAVNNLAAKLQMTLFPANSPFFRLGVETGVMAKLVAAAGGDPEVEKAIERQLSMVEQDSVKFAEEEAIRVQLFHGLRYLIVVGNVLLYFPPKEGEKVQVYRLDKFCVRRSPSGKVLEIVIQEFIAPDEVPEDVASEAESAGTKPSDKEAEKNVAVYTWIRYDTKRKRYTGFQEIWGQQVEGTDFDYPEDKMPYLALAWHLGDGDNYGRGHVEDYIGDWLSLEALSQALLEGAAAMATLIFLVSPTGMTKVADLKKARNLGYVAGNAEDVTVLQANKYGDFQVAQNEKNEIAMRLARAFLLNESIQRDAERVTAEEIRLMARELEDSLGGIFSVLSVELQLPMARMILRAMTQRGKLGQLPKEVKPTIVTGFEALGRGHDIAKLKAALSDIAPLGPEVIMQSLKIDEYIDRVFTAHGINTEGLLYTPEEKKAMQEQAQQQKLMEMAGPEAAKAIAPKLVGATEGEE